MAGDRGPLRLLRPDDLLVLTVRLTNLEVSPDRRSLARVDPDQPAALTFELPPQHQSERAFLEWEDGYEPAAPAPIQVVTAAPSRLAFTLPEGQQSWPLDVATLLDWAGLTPSLAGNAVPPDATSGPAPGSPAPDQTALELPYRLVLSPDQHATWSHRTDPFGAGGRTELWHTRLRYPPTGDRGMPVRAVHHRDVPNSFAASLTTGDLSDLVTLTGDFTNQPKSAQELGLPLVRWLQLLRDNGLDSPIVPVPLRAEQLMLSALGASVRMQGHFDFPTETQLPDQLALLGVRTPSLLQYEHIMGSGRDQWVKVVRRGYVHTGQRACIVKVSHRTFEPQQVGTEQGPNGPIGIFGTKAYLRQYYQVVILEPVLDYRPLAAGYIHRGREMPLRTLQLTTLTTPKLDLPLPDGQTPQSLTNTYLILWRIQHPGVPVDHVAIGRQVQADIEAAFKTPFWITAKNAKVPFGFVATDWEGRPVSGSMPLLFVPYDLTTQPGSGSVVTAKYLAAGAERTVSFGGQTMAIADPAGSTSGSTAVPVDSVTFGMQPLASRDGLPARYLPRWLWLATRFGVHLEAAERLTGSSAPALVDLDPAYLARGLAGEANPAGRFAKLVTPGQLAFGGSRGGGLAQPRSALEVLTSRAGLVPAQFAGGAVTTATLEAILSGAKLFGTLDLASILGDIPAPGPDTYALADLPEAALQALLDDPARWLPVPVLRSRRVPGPDGADGAPTAVEARFVWKPLLRTDPDLKPLVDVGGAQFVLDVRSVTPVAGGPAETTVRGELRGFSLSFGGVVKVSFGRLAFLALPGRKPDVTADGVGLDFLGPLEFVNTLRDVIPSSGFSDPPAVSVTPQGITAGYSLSVPSVGVGIFSLQNLSLSAALSLPFVGKPAGLRFAVSEREHPFLVSVTLFGGGGFFALGVSANGVEEVEAAIEFGGNVSLNLGVASGGVYVMAGVYFGLKPSGCKLTGYLRCGGYLSVLGLISISIEFYLAFEWRQKAGGGSEIWGQASVTVKVKVVCFSKSVTLSVERRFAGASGDPSLDQVLTPADWQDYCLAFAPEGAA